MSLPHIIMWIIAVCVGLPAAYRNPAAAALSLSWLAGEVTWMVTGNSLPLSVYIMADIAVITVILAKGIVRAGPETYPRLTVWDSLIIGLFVFGAWPVYLSTLHAYYQWWALFYITIAQFVFAGMEPVSNWYTLHRAKRRVRPDNILQFAPAYSRRVKRYFAPSMRGRGGA